MTAEDTELAHARNVTWLRRWAEEHSSGLAAQRVSDLLGAYLALKEDAAAFAAAKAGPAEDTTALRRLRDSMASRIPQDSVWDAANLGDEERVLQYALHLYHSHTLGCEDCFGPHVRI